MQRAEQEAAAAEIGLHVAVARRLWGVLSGEAALVESADAWMRGQGIRNPQRMAEITGPGRWS